MARCTARSTLALAAVVALPLAGCAKLSKAYPERRHFRLAIPPVRQAGKPTEAGMTLKVTPFTVSDAFRGVEFAYRTDENTWETDFYNVFLLPPAAQVAEVLRTHVAASGRLGQVIQPGSAAEATHRLEGHLRSIYADFTDPRLPKAVVSLELTLLDIRSGSPRILFHEVYERTAPTDASRSGQAARGEAVVKGWNAALEQIVRDFDKQVADAFRPKPKTK